jgi:hypothetical protein
LKKEKESLEKEAERKLLKVTAETELPQNAVPNNAKE